MNKVILLYATFLLLGCGKNTVSTPLILTLNGDITCNDTTLKGVYNETLGIEMDREYSAYYHNGDLRTIEEIDENGVSNGLYLEFHSDFTIYLSGQMKNGLPNGHWKTYSDNGILVKYSFMEDGEKLEELIHPMRDSIIDTVIRHSQNPTEE